MKYSIKHQLIFVFISILTGTIILCWFLNNTFLVKYYLKNKQQVLKKAYESVNYAMSEGNIESEDFEKEFNKVCTIYNISVIVIDANSKEIQSAGNDRDFMMRDLLDRVFVLDSSDFTIIEQNNNYVMQTTNSHKTNMTYIEMWGTLDNGNLFMTRSTLESIHESVEISNRFLAYVGIFAALFSALLIWIITKHITDPILSLTNISKQMSQ